MAIVDYVFADLLSPSKRRRRSNPYPEQIERGEGADQVLAQGRGGGMGTDAGFSRAGLENVQNAASAEYVGRAALLYAPGP